jgi:hypothetical protein
VRPPVSGAGNPRSTKDAQAKGQPFAKQKTEFRIHEASDREKLIRKTEATL